MGRNQQLRSDSTCKRLCNQMQQFSGLWCSMHTLFLFTFFFRRTQQTLNEGVEKVRAIYKNFDNVGIKDRSMIWNS
jgi:hypothetical protein